jgi:hypothetical protein
MEPQLQEWIQPCSGYVNLPGGGWKYFRDVGNLGHLEVEDLGHLEVGGLERLKLPAARRLLR